MGPSRIQGAWLTSGLWVGRVFLDGDAQQTFSDWLVVMSERVLGARTVGYNNLNKSNDSPSHKDITFYHLIFLFYI
jgi:hypothetical protein